MKIKPEHLEQMRESITPFDTPANRKLYREGSFPKANATSDVNKRYRWDLFFKGEDHRSPYTPTTKWMCDVLYPYLNDSHVDTALRSIVQPLELTKKYRAGGRDFDTMDEALNHAANVQQRTRNIISVEAL